MKFFLNFLFFYISYFVCSLEDTILKKISKKIPLKESEYKELIANYRDLISIHSDIFEENTKIELLLAKRKEDILSVLEKSNNDLIYKLLNIFFKVNLGFSLSSLILFLNNYPIFKIYYLELLSKVLFNKILKNYFDNNNSLQHDHRIFASILFLLIAYFFKNIEKIYLNLSSGEDSVADLNVDMIEKLLKLIKRKHELLEYKKIYNEKLGCDKNEFIYHILEVLTINSITLDSIGDVINKTELFAQACEDEVKAERLYFIVEEMFPDESLMLYELKNKLEIKNMVFFYSFLTDEFKSMVNQLEGDLYIRLVQKYARIIAFFFNKEKKSQENIIFYGPSGAGKTQLMNNIIFYYHKEYRRGDDEIIFFDIKNSELNSKSAAHSLMQQINNLLLKKNKIIIKIDEADGVIGKDEKFISQLIDSCKGRDVVFLIATNFISSISDNVISKDRFANQENIELSSYDSRVRFFTGNLGLQNKNNRFLNGSAFQNIRTTGLPFIFALITEGMSIASINAFFREYMDFCSHLYGRFSMFFPQAKEITKGDEREMNIEAKKNFVNVFNDEMLDNMVAAGYLDEAINKVSNKKFLFIQFNVLFFYHYIYKLLDLDEEDINKYLFIIISCYANSFFSGSEDFILYLFGKNDSGYCGMERDRNAYNELNEVKKKSLYQYYDDLFKEIPFFDVTFYGKKIEFYLSDKDKNILSLFKNCSKKKLREEKRLEIAMLYLKDNFFEKRSFLGAKRLFNKLLFVIPKKEEQEKGILKEYESLFSLNPNLKT